MVVSIWYQLRKWSQKSEKLHGNRWHQWQTKAMASFLGQLLCRLMLMSVSLARCSSDWIVNVDGSLTLATKDCDTWCYIVAFCTPLSLSFMPVFQWFWIHRDMIPYLLCKKQSKSTACDRCFWWDANFSDEQ